jgi:hypothetical protein
MRRYVFRLALLSMAALAPHAVLGDDQQIAQQIMQKLKAEKDAGNLKGFSIDLQVDEGTVWLSGRVASELQQSKALDIARRIPGVQQVVNDLTISLPPARPVAVAAQPPVNLPPAGPSFGGGKPGVVMHPAPVAVPAPLPPPAVAAAGQPTPAGAGMAIANPFAASKRSAPGYEAAPPVMTSDPAAQQVVAVPVVEEATAEQERSARRPSSPAHNSVLNSISKTLVSAVNGGKQLDEPRPVQAASVSQEVASATGGPVGSGVDSSASTRRSVVQAAQPVANVPQGVTTADGLRPLTPGMPQMAMPMQMPYMVPVYAGTQMQVPLAMGPARTVNYAPVGGAGAGGPAQAPMPMYLPGSGVGMAPARYDHPAMPGYAWPSYAAYPNYAAVTYPKQYSPTAWPYIGPFYPYPQVPLGWRKVTMEWDDGWWFLDFKDRRTMYNH